MTTTSSMNDMEVTDLSDPIMFSDPFPRYAQLRQNSPVSKVVFNLGVKSKGYMLSRYEDVLTVHTDTRLSSDLMKNGGAGMVKFMPRMFRLLTGSMVFKDDPEHKRLRALVSKAFTPKMIKQMEDDIVRIVNESLDDMKGKNVVDLVEEFAVRVPLAVISNMLGIEPADRDQFHFWTKKVINSTTSGALAMVRVMPTASKMMKMFERLAQHGRAQPDEMLISSLVLASEDGDTLSDEEILAMIFLLLLAGHDTTANLIGNSVLALLDNPDQLERLRNDPTLIDTAVEEFLRYTSPVPCGTSRIAMEDVEIAGVTIPKGSNLLGMIISANRDESVFTDPGVLDIGRSPNRHIAFAFGAHFCLGSQLARMEGRAALSALVERFGDIRLAVPRDQLTWKPTESLRGLRSLPLHLN